MTTILTSAQNKIRNSLTKLNKSNGKKLSQGKKTPPERNSVGANSETRNHTDTHTEVRPDHQTENP